MLPIFGDSYRPSSQWLHDLALKLDAFEALKPLSATVAVEIDRHLIVEQVAQNLRLGDLELSTGQVAEVVGGRPPVDQAERAAASFAAAVHRLQEFAARDRAEATLTSERLSELHALATEGLGAGGGSFRQSPGRPLAPDHTPAVAEALPALVENALAWFGADSFRELHPVEQAWLAHLRLMDLQPFATANGRVARLASSLYTLRAGLPPVIVSADWRELYHHALMNSFQMITQPGVELFARALGRVLDEVTAIANDET